MLLIFLISCKTKTNVKEYTATEVGWTISIPEDFTMLDSAQILALNTKGSDAIQKTYDTLIDMSATKTLMSIKKGDYNFLTATITPYNEQQDGNWEETNEALKAVLVETFASQAPDLKVDTSSGIEKIGGLDFRFYEMNLDYPNGMKITVLIYSRLHNGYDFGISLTYNDKSSGDRLKEIVKTSRFN